MPASGQDSGSIGAEVEEGIRLSLADFEKFRPQHPGVIREEQGSGIGKLEAAAVKAPEVSLSGPSLPCGALDRFRSPA